MDEIYFDNASTTRVSLDVIKTAVKLMYEDYANPSSIHEKGFIASQLLQKSRNQVASLMGSTSEEIVFTSGGTESNNLAILGAARALKRRGKKVITTKIEHPSVLKAFEQLREEGFEVYEIKPLHNGQLDIDVLEKLVDDNTILVSCGMVNSELGTIAPIEKAVRIVKAINPDIIFHTDAVQAFGKIPFSVARLGVDLASVSGHKIYAPNGVGAIYIKKGVRLIPLMYGGGQENSFRPGTENTPGICAFGQGAEIVQANMQSNFEKVTDLCKHFINKAENTMGIRMNSDSNSTPYICNISVPGYRSETLVHYLADFNIYLSSGSACAKGKKSHVLTAIELSNQRIDSALRISFCPENTEQEIDIFFDKLKKAREDLIRS